MICIFLTTKNEVELRCNIMLSSTLAPPQSLLCNNNCCVGTCLFHTAPCTHQFFQSQNLIQLVIEVTNLIVIKDGPTGPLWKKVEELWELEQLDEEEHPPMWP